jgi:ABC-2 type transport system permease protein
MATMISARRTGALLLRQYYLIRGSAARLMPLFIWVTIDMVLWGFITKYLNTVSAGVDFVPQLLGAVLLWDFFTRVMQGVTLAFFEDVWSRNFLNLFASPLSIGEYVTGLVLSTIATSAVGVVVMLLLADVVFGLSFFSFGIALLPFLLSLFLFGIALGIVACAMVFRLGPAAEWFVWPIPGLISPFVGVFYPLATLPRWMQYIGYTMPPAYVFEGVRAIVSGREPPPLALVWSVVLSVAYVAAAAWTFATVYRGAVRTGLLTRYSAETLT